MSTRMKPILFNTEMSIALKEQRKTQTRRLRGLEELNTYPGNLEGECPLGKLGYRGLLEGTYILSKKAKADFNKNPGLYHWFLGEQGKEINPIPVKAEYAVGDVLYVRETWAKLEDYKGIDPGSGALCAECFYKTDYPDGLWYEVVGDKGHDKKVCWRPSIHMPKWAARLFLEVVDVSAERVQEISEEDSISEGSDWSGVRIINGRTKPSSHKLEFAAQWDSIYHNWEANPWVFAYTFKVIDKPEDEK